MSNENLVNTMHAFAKQELTRQGKAQREHSYEPGYYNQFYWLLCKAWLWRAVEANQERYDACMELDDQRDYMHPAEQRDYAMLMREG